MIVHDCRQGSEEWIKLRLGRPTCSQFDRIIAPRTLRASDGQAKYRTDLLIEWLTNEPIQSYTNEWTRRGIELESAALVWYELEYGCKTERPGFITRDDGLVGGSPDALVGSNGATEIKCPSPQVQQSYLAGKDPGYIGQCQGLLYVTEREWVDLLCYHPDLPPLVKRVERDERYQKALIPILEGFVMQLEQEKFRLSRARRPGSVGQATKDGG